MSQPTIPFLRKSTTWVLIATAVAGTLSGGVAGLSAVLRDREHRPPPPVVRPPSSEPFEETHRFVTIALDGRNDRRPS